MPYSQEHEEEWEERKRIQRGEQHPLRGQFRNFYGSRPELGGTPNYSRDWLKLRDTSVPRFEGKLNKKDRAREQQGRRAAAPITFNMFDMSQDRSDRSITTTNNYMGGRGFEEGEPNWGTPGTEFQDAEVFEPMHHDLSNVRQSGGGWDQPAGDLGTGATGIGSGGGQDAIGI